MAGPEARATTGILYPIIHNLAQFVKQKQLVLEKSLDKGLHYHDRL